MPCLTHDPMSVSAGPERLGDKPGPQAVPPDLLRREPDGGGRRFDHGGDRVPVDRAADSPVRPHRLEQTLRALPCRSCSRLRGPAHVGVDVESPTGSHDPGPPPWATVDTVAGVDHGTPAEPGAWGAQQAVAGIRQGVGAALGFGVGLRHPHHDVQSASGWRMTSSTVRAASSERRNAPTHPMTSRHRLRIPAGGGRPPGGGNGGDKMLEVSEEQRHFSGGWGRSRPSDSGEGVAYLGSLAWRQQLGKFVGPC